MPHECIHAQLDSGSRTPLTCFPVAVMARCCPRMSRAARVKVPKQCSVCCASPTFVSVVSGEALSRGQILTTASTFLSLSFSLDLPAYITRCASHARVAIPQASHVSFIWLPLRRCCCNVVVNAFTPLFGTHHG